MPPYYSELQAAAASELTDAVSRARETLGEGVSHLSDEALTDKLGSMGLAAVSEGLVTLADAKAAQENIAAQLNTGVDRVELADAVGALMRAHEDFESKSPEHFVPVAVQATAFDNTPTELQGEVRTDTLLQAVAEVDNSLSIVRGRLGDGVSELSDEELLARLKPAGVEAVLAGDVTLEDAQDAQRFIAERLGVDVESVGLAESVDALVRALDDLEKDYPAGKVNVSIEMTGDDGETEQVSRSIKSEQLVDAVASYSADHEADNGDMSWD